MKACYSKIMRDADRKASEIYNIPSIVLMENAAISCVNKIIEKFGSIKNKSFAVFCGKGNNGGDGFAIARHLINKGANVRIFIICGYNFSNDAKINFDILEKIGADITDDITGLEYKLPMYDMTVDAVFGTGLHGELCEETCRIIEDINKYSKSILSVDVPSGLNADTGEICGACIKADITVTFAAYKIGMLMFPGYDYIGEVVVGDISMPKQILSECGINIITKNFVKKNFPKRQNDSHKGNYGKILIIGGSTGMTGAPYLSAQAAINSGAGLVTIGACESINNILEEKTTEVMTFPLTDKNGHLSLDCIDELISLIEGKDAVLFGPGLGRSDDIYRILRELLCVCTVPLIIDADGLYALSKDMEMLEESKCNLIFTPHEMEMSRLIDADISYIKNNRLEASSELAQEFGTTLILKGHHTVVTAPDGLQYINIIGNSGMASAGSGDVLAGICTALVARGIDETKAAAMAVYIHSFAGDICMDKYGIESVTAGRILDEIPTAIKNILN